MGCYISYKDSISEKNLSVKIDNKSKEYKYNGKKTTFDEFYGKLNVITFIPEDIELIVGSPSIRRTFFDSEISQSSYEYFKNLKDYTKILKIRNKYLKEKNIKNDLYKIYEDEFVKLASKLIFKRIEYIKNMSN